MSSGKTAEVAFHRRYRPNSITEYLGENIKSIIENRFYTQNTYPQTILLYGTRGCGKTSLARLMALEYHCIDKVDGRACGKCEMCLEIQEKLIQSQAGVETFGVQEVDIASDGGKAAMDSILEDALIEPAYPLKYKVIIMDECHMATPQAQNRLLKIVEEPPEHLVFIFCTTDPDRVIGTLKSRCQLKIEVRKPTIDELVGRLLVVCKQEGITTSMEALKIIAKKSDRIPREALNLLESVAKDCGNRVTITDIREKTGDVAAEIYMEYFQAANKSLESIMIMNRKIKDENISPRDFIRGLTRFTLDCIYIRYAIAIEDYPLEYVKQVKKFFSVYNSEELDYLLQIVEHASKLVDTDDTKAELVITTTAMRIGKLKLLGIDLSREGEQSKKENKSSIKKYRDRVRDEQEASKQVAGVNVDSALLLSVFGKQVKEITGGINILDNSTSSIDGTDMADSVSISDEELLKLFEG